MADTTNQPLLLQLPLEIRLIIYEYLLFPSLVPSSSHSTSVTNLLPDYHTYHSGDSDSPFTLAVRTINPYLGAHTSRSWRKRSTYHVRTGPFLTTTTPTTYRVLLTPHTAHLRHTIPSLLPLSRQIHFEASKVLYSAYTFSFHTSIEAAVPFLSDLTSLSRSYIRSIGITKKGFPYTKEFDRAEWSALCTYISSELCLRKLDLSVVAGRPGDEGWEGIKPITVQDFELMQRMKREWGTEIGGVDLDWVQQLFKVKGLRDVGVRALIEHCPGSVSETMAFWIAFSASVEDGFGEWVRGKMVAEV
ncbi:hypothetical protein K458DRAFT_296703 [Lentithecium fluviatile CBS 122367]|uniref:Uncharacterized protein n=1 Tax=Lentithecium fluviatile CBS 122367 TaxID=1168545 RepID=A0A6G1JAH2_9PLEO|nr:hypothetical protein K458DRAFT_296703 [Lentithecium fluviatile CBS 122367]